MPPARPGEPTPRWSPPSRAAPGPRSPHGSRSPTPDVDFAFVAVGAACDSIQVEPTLDPGAEFTVCVVRQSELPAIPTVLQGRGITTEARYDVQIDDFRTS